MIDIRKVERPHRSGLIAICVAYALLYIAADVSWIGQDGGPPSWKDIIACQLAPMLCINLGHAESSAPPKHYRVTSLITYCPRCRVVPHKKRACEETRYFADGNFRYFAAICETKGDCDDFFTSLPSGAGATCWWGDWKENEDAISVTMHPIMHPVVKFPL